MALLISLICFFGLSSNSKALEPEKNNHRHSQPGVEIQVFGSVLGAPNSPSARIYEKEEIQNSPAVDLGDFFKNQGESVLSSGGIGSQSFLFLKGGDPDKVLVLLDGVPLNDPTNPNRSFDFSQISLSGLDRIEVLSGAQNTRFGGQALSGVVRLFSKSSARRGLSGRSQITGGNFQRKRLQISNQWAQKNWSIGGDAELFKVVGPSAAAKGIEPDGVQRESFALNGRVQPHRGSSIQGRSQFFRQSSDLDAGPFNDTNDFKILTQRWAHTLSSQTKVSEDFHLSLAAGHNATSRQVRGDKQSGWFDGSFDRFEALNEYTFKRFSLAGGAEATFEQARYSQTFQSAQVDLPQSAARKFDLFLLPSYAFTDRLKVAGGYRSEDHSVYGSAPSAELQLEFFWTDHDLIYLRSALGQKFPSLDQLFGPFGGNQFLKPENLLTHEIGWRREYRSSKFVIELFQHRYRNQISFDQNFQNINIDRSEVSGVETQQEFELSPTLTFNNRYQYTDTKRTESRALLRRPYHQAFQQITYKPSENLNLRVQHRYVGTRWDYLSPQASIKMRGFSLINAVVSYQPSTHDQFQLSIENIAKTEYQEIYGFNGNPQLWFLSYQRRW